MTADFDREFVERLLTTPQYHRWLGLTLVEAEPGRVVVGMPYRKEFLADTAGSYVHGGLLATLADVAGDFALVSSLGYVVPTIDLRMDYLRPAHPDTVLVAEGKVVRRGRQSGVADAEVSDENGRLLAVGRGVYGTALPAEAAR